jgi:hypothetical protein
LVTELSPGAGQGLGGLLLGLGVTLCPLFDVAHSSMQDLANDSAEPVHHRPERLRVASPRPQSVEYHLPVAAFGLQRSLGGFAQHPPQIFIAFSRTTALVLFGTLWQPRTSARPELNCAAEANALACAPTSAITCCAESAPNPGTSASPTTASWCSRRPARSSHSASPFALRSVAAVPETAPTLAGAWPSLFPSRQR